MGTDGLALLTTASSAPGPHQARADREIDPHVWHDVSQTMGIVQTIRDTLCRADPAQAPAYTAAAERYVAMLQALDAWIIERMQTVPHNRRQLVTAHNTFGYFAQRYGFELVGAVLPAVSTEATDPTGAEMAALVTKLRTTEPPALFAEHSHHSPLIERLAAAAGVHLAPPLYTDALGQPGIPGDTYIKMMHYNVTTIVEALSR